MARPAKSLPDGPPLSRISFEDSGEVAREI
jgi:hypothetical protein